MKTERISTEAGGAVMFTGAGPPAAISDQVAVLVPDGSRFWRTDLGSLWALGTARPVPGDPATLALRVRNSIVAAIYVTADRIRLQNDENFRSVGRHLRGAGYSRTCGLHGHRRGSFLSSVCRGRSGDLGSGPMFPLLVCYRGVAFCKLTICHLADCEQLVS